MYTLSILVARSKLTTLRPFFLIASLVFTKITSVAIQLKRLKCNYVNDLKKNPLKPEQEFQHYKNGSLQVEGKESLLLNNLPIEFDFDLINLKFWFNLI